MTKRELLVAAIDNRIYEDTNTGCCSNEKGVEADDTENDFSYIAWEVKEKTNDQI